MSPLEEAQTAERELRAQLAELIGAKQRADREARRLSARAQLPDADPLMSELVERYRAQAQALDPEITGLRRTLRRAEAHTEALRAQEGTA